MRLLLLLLCLAAPAARAETQMTADEFQDWSTGKTLDYFIDGTLWGSETHLAGRETVDDGERDICRPGRWSARADDICFTYDDGPGTFCWRFVKDGDQVFAQDADDLSAPRFSVTRSDAPVACPSTGAGV